MVLDPLQIILIALLVIIVPIGFLNQRKRVKMKKEMDYHEVLKSSQTGEYSNDKIINYIEKYKAQYPRDSIKSALINAGNSSEEVEKYLNKFY